MHSWLRCGSIQNSRILFEVWNSTMSYIQHHCLASCRCLLRNAVVECEMEMCLIFNVVFSSMNPIWFVLKCNPESNIIIKIWSGIRLMFARNQTFSILAKIRDSEVSYHILIIEIRMRHMRLCSMNWKPKRLTRRQPESLKMALGASDPRNMNQQ